MSLLSRWLCCPGNFLLWINSVRNEFDRLRGDSWAGGYILEKILAHCWEITHGHTCLEKNFMDHIWVDFEAWMECMYCNFIMPKRPGGLHQRFLQLIPGAVYFWSIFLCGVVKAYFGGTYFLWICCLMGWPERERAVMLIMRDQGRYHKYRSLHMDHGFVYVKNVFAIFLKHEKLLCLFWDGCL